ERLSARPLHERDGSGNGLEELPPGWQGPRGLLQGDGARLPQLPPHGHPMPRWLSRKAVSEKEPLLAVVSSGRHTFECSTRYIDWAGGAGSIRAGGGSRRQAEQLRLLQARSLDRRGARFCQPGCAVGVRTRLRGGESDGWK